MSEEEVYAMSLLESYIECLKAGDAGRMASLFAQDAEFYDDVPVSRGRPPTILKGRDNIEAFFKQTFNQGGLPVDNVAINDNAMRYDIVVRGMPILALSVMKEENNLIKEYRVVGL